MGERSARAVDRRAVERRLSRRRLLDGHGRSLHRTPAPEDRRRPSPRRNASDKGRTQMTRRLAIIGLVVAIVPAGFRAQDLSVPNRPHSLKFAAIGDNGTGEQAEYDVASQMDRWRQRFPFDMVIMLGDSIYGSQAAADFIVKFERPFK